jgi:hypothetical protein
MVSRTSSLLLVALLVAPPSLAGEERFGTTGTWVPSGAVYLDLTSTRHSTGETTTSYSLMARPEVSRFVSHGLSVGMGPYFHWYKSPTSHSTAWGIDAVAGYNVWLADDVSLWPSLTLSAYHSTFTGTVYLGEGRRTVDLDATLSVPLLFHVGHFYLGFGPSLFQDLLRTVQEGDAEPEGDDRDTRLALGTTFGGWL